jgi:cell shape-determining protein MreD
VAPENRGKETALGVEESSPFLTAVPVLIVLYLLFVGVLALLAQMILPVIFAVTFPTLNVLGFNSTLIPLLVIYASLELGDERAPLIAAILGLLLDLNSPPSARLGTSMFILTGLSVLITTQAHKPESHLWFIRLTFVLVGTFAFLLLDYIFILIQTARWSWPLDVWSKITFASLFNVVLSPIFFFLVSLPLRLCGWRPAYEQRERRYAR